MTNFNRTIHETNGDSRLFGKIRQECKENGYKLTSNAYWAEVWEKDGEEIIICR